MLHDFNESVVPEALLGFLIQQPGNEVLASLCEVISHFKVNFLVLPNAFEHLGLIFLVKRRLTH
jgi:hypothetical protein